MTILVSEFFRFSSFPKLAKPSEIITLVLRGKTQVNLSLPTIVRQKTVVSDIVLDATEFDICQQGYCPSNIGFSYKISFRRKFPVLAYIAISETRKVIMTITVSISNINFHDCVTFDLVARHTNESVVLSSANKASLNAHELIFSVDNQPSHFNMFTFVLLFFLIIVLMKCIYTFIAIACSIKGYFIRHSRYRGEQGHDSLDREQNTIVEE